VKDLDDQISLAAGRVAALARERGVHVGTAESLTAGMVCAALGAVTGVSGVLRGGVVSYADAVKSAVLGVDPRLLHELGAVSEPVAVQMADAARRVLGADLTVATTGVAGPGPSQGVSAGTVVIAVAGPQGARPAVTTLNLTGDRAQVRSGATLAALSMLISALERPGSRPGSNAPAPDLAPRGG